MRLTVCEHDAELHARRRGVFTLGAALSPGEALAELPEDERPDRPEDCNKPCWRHQPDGCACTCDDETEGGVFKPGC